MIRIQFVAVLMSAMLLAGCSKPPSRGVPNVSIFQSMHCVQPFVAHTSSVTSVALKLLTVQDNVPKGQHPQDAITVFFRETGGGQIATTTCGLATGTNGWITIPFPSGVALVSGQPYGLHVHDGENGWFGWEFVETPDGRGTFGAPEANQRVEFYYKLNPE